MATNETIVVSPNRSTASPIKKVPDAVRARQDELPFNTWQRWHCIGQWVRLYGFAYDFKDVDADAKDFRTESYQSDSSGDSIAITYDSDEMERKDQAKRAHTKAMIADVYPKEQICQMWMKPDNLIYVAYKSLKYGEDLDYTFVEAHRYALPQMPFLNLMSEALEQRDENKSKGSKTTNPDELEISWHPDEEWMQHGKVVQVRIDEKHWNDWTIGLVDGYDSKSERIHVGMAEFSTWIWPQKGYNIDKAPKNVHVEKRYFELIQDYEYFADTENTPLFDLRIYNADCFGFRLEDDQSVCLKRPKGHKRKSKQVEKFDESWLEALVKMFNSDPLNSLKVVGPHQTIDDSCYVVGHWLVGKKFTILDDSQRVQTDAIFTGYDGMEGMTGSLSAIIAEQSKQSSLKSRSKSDEYFWSIEHSMDSESTPIQKENQKNQLTVKIKMSNFR